jgi:hypothetical protein
MRGSEDAFNWLMKHKFIHFGALDRAIDGDTKALMWLRKHNYPILARLAGACNSQPEAIAFFKENNLPVFLMIADKYIAFRENQVFDYHKRQF